LQRIGFQINAEHVFTSLTAARDLAISEGLKSVPLLSLEPELTISSPLLLLSDSASTEFPILQGEKDSVVIGLSTSLTYSQLNTAYRILLKASTKLIATHKATHYRASDGELSLGPGVFVDGLEIASGKKAVVVGKPSRAFFQTCLHSLGMEAEEVAVIGDDIKNDLGGACEELGMQRWLVKTGKYREGDEVDGVEVFQDFRQAVEELIGHANC